jgi:hypothetical protein
MCSVRLLIAVLWAISSPALAQTGGVPSYIPNDANPRASNSNLSSMTCQQMMDRARSRFESKPPGTAKTYARSENYLANRAMESGNDELCKARMRKVMGDLR